MTFAKTIERWLKRDLSGLAAGSLSTSTTRGRVTGAPPRKGELGAVNLDELTAHHAPLIDRIRVAYAGAECSFDVQVAPLIQRFAAFVHLLPATRDGHFRDPAGCLHCGLEVGLHALQAADGQIFSARGTVPERRAAAPRWRAAALAMGLCSEVHRPVFGAVVRDEQDAQWNPLLMPLFDWLRQGGRERYRIEWSQTGAPTRSATLAVLPQILHIPYRGAAPAVTDLLGGQVRVGIVGMPPTVAHAKSGKLRILAVTSEKRSATMPDAPAVAELPGFAGYRFTNWMGVYVPAKTPPAIIERLAGEIGQIVREPETRAKLLAGGVEPVGSTPAEFAAFLKAEREMYSKVAKERGIRAED